MNDLEKRVKGDWYDVREAFQDYTTLDQYFRISNSDLRTHAEKLQMSVEQGVVEYKQNSISPLFRILEDTKYQSLTAEQIANQTRYIDALLFIVLIQRLFADGVIRFSRRKKTGDDEIKPADLDFKYILEDINKRVGENPELKANPSVKMILLQVGMYKKEQQSLKNLLATIKPESKKALVANFNQSFAEIIDKIKRNYIELLHDEAPPTDDNKRLVELVPVKQTVPILTSQGAIISRIRSALNFVSEEKYKTREILVNLANVREQIFDLFEKEIESYCSFFDVLSAARKAELKITAFPNLLSRALCNEIIQFLEKELAYRQSLGRA